MKKLFLSAAVVLAMTMVSCGGSKSEKATEGTDDTVAFEEVDIVEVDGVAAQADTAVGTAADVAAAAQEGVTEEGQGIIDKLKNSKAGAEAVAIAGQAKDYIVKLVSSGEIQEAKQYFAQVGPYIKEKAPKVYDSIKAVVDNDTLKEKASAVKDAAKEKASEVTDAAKEKASEVTNAAKDKLKNVF